MFFDLTGASASYLLTDGNLIHAVIPVVIALVLLVSWATRPASRKLNFSS